MADTSVVAQLRAWLTVPGAGMTAEAEELGYAVRDIIASGERLTTKTLMSYVIHELELSTDGVRQETLRRVLELLVSRSPCDPGT